MSGRIKVSIARIFEDDREVNQQMLLSLNPGLVVHFFHGWCLKDDICRTINEVAKRNRAESVIIFKDGLRTYLLDRDENHTNIIDELEQIIDTFQSADAGESIINLLRKRLDALKQTNDSQASDQNSQVGAAGGPSCISGDVSKAVAHLKVVFVEQFQIINPLPFEGDIELKLDDCWINLELLNTKLESKTADKIDCLVKVSEAFSLRNVVLCKGDPGCGKSTLCNYLCYQWGNGNWNEFGLVLFARLRDVQETESILELAVNWMCDLNFFDDKQMLLKMAKGNRKTLVILDGYDEKIGICNQLEKLLQSSNYHLSFNLLLTSCSWAIDKERIKYKGRAQILVITPLVLNQQKEYAQKIIKDEKKVQKLLAAINKYDDSLKKLAQTILLFSYMCYYCMTQKGNDFILPFKNVDQLYWELFARLVDRYEEKKNIVTEWNWETSEQIRRLGKMAMGGLVGERQSQLSFTVEDLDHFHINECYCTGAGLLIKNCYSRPGASSIVYYSFAHRTAQEFLARKFMVDVYREIDVSHFFDNNLFNVLEAAKSHPDVKDAVDQLESVAFYFRGQLISMATNDSRNVEPVAIMIMDVSERTLIYLLLRARLLYNLLTPLKNRSDQTPEVLVSRVVDVFKKCIYTAIYRAIENGKLRLLVSNYNIGAFLDLCHDVELLVVSVSENQLNGNQSNALFYFTSLNTLWFVESCYLKQAKHAFSNIKISRLPQHFTNMAIHSNVSKDWYSRTSLSLRSIGSIYVYDSLALRPDKPSLLLECSTHVAQSRAHTELGITLSQLWISDSHLPPPPVTSSSITFDDIGSFLDDCFNDMDCDSFIMVEHCDEMQLNVALSKSFPVSEFEEFMAPFKNLKLVDLNGSDLEDDEERMSEAELEAFIQWIKSLGPNVFVKYNPASRLGQILDHA